MHLHWGRLVVGQECRGYHEECALWVARTCCQLSTQWCQVRGRSPRDDVVALDTALVMFVEDWVLRLAANLKVIGGKHFLRDIFEA